MPDDQAALQAGEQLDVPGETVLWVLRTIVLTECSAKRGPSPFSRPGRLDMNQVIDSRHEGNLLVYAVESRATFYDPQGEMLAEAAFTFGASYLVGEDEPSAEAVDAFSASVVLHVTPFVREFLATITNRLGIPPFLMPLQRRQDVEQAFADSAAEGQLPASG